MPLPFVIGAAILAATAGSAYLVHENNEKSERQARARAREREKELEAQEKRAKKEKIANDIVRLKKEYGYNISAKEVNEKLIASTKKLIEVSSEDSSNIKHPLSFCMNRAQANAKIKKIIKTCELTIE